MHNEFTSVIEQDGEWFIGYCPEIPGANGQGHTVDSHRLLVDHGRSRVDGRGVHDRRLLRDVELQEVVPAVEGRRVERVDVRPVGEREPLARRSGEVLGQIWAVTAGLLVSPLARHVHGHPDLLDKRDRR